MQFVPVEKATTTREASTANFLIDSFDRQSGNASDFTINASQSLFNGFFTRISVAEVGMNWGIPNISTYFGNNEFSVEIASTGVQYTATLPDGNYTVASALTDIVALLNTQIGSTFFSLVGNYTNNQGVRLLGTANFEVLNTDLQEQLTVQTGQVALGFFIQNPNLLAYRYVDFICDNLTYHQSLKDNSTSGQSRNTLYRWNFAWDSPAPIDTLGFPIYQGYQAFTARRNFAFPKQIRWEGNMPIGQLRFVVQTEYNLPLVINFPTAQFEWNMTTLITEV
jgi:hypothetical protein